MREKYENDFDAGMGAEAIKKPLADINCEKLSEELRAELKDATGQKKAKIVKRLEVVGAVPPFGQRSPVDDNRHVAGHPARASPDGSARRRQVRYSDLNATSSPRNKPQQPP